VSENQHFWNEEYSDKMVREEIRVIDRRLNFRIHS
jgi:hypothetical protein